MTTSSISSELKARLEAMHADLNPEQREAAMAVDGPVIVVAGAGAGKTKTLIHRVATLIEMGVPPAHIMIVTFTNKAAQEIRERLVGMVGELGDHVVAGTFHSAIFNKMLKPATDSTYLTSQGIDPLTLAILDEDESNKLLKEAYAALDEEDQELIESNEWKLRTFQDMMGRARARGDDVETFEARLGTALENNEQSRILVRLWRDYEQRCRQVSGIDFDDILVYAARMLDEDPDIAVRLADEFRYLMLDEYQDTNPVQMKIMDSIAQHHKNIFVVGDEKQSIYGFRGADISVILSFKKRYPEARQVNMVRNYRSDPAVITAANACARSMSQRLSDGQLLAMRASSGRAPVIIEFPSALSEASTIAKAIQRDLRAGVPGKEIAVLYRKRNLKTELERELVEADLPFELIGDVSFYQKAEVKDALAMIRFIFRPWDSMGVLRTIRATSLGISEKAVREAIYEKKMTGIGFLQEQSERRLKATKKNEVGELSKTAVKLQPFLKLADAVREAGDAGDDPAFIKDCLARFWEIYLRPGLVKSSQRASSNDGIEGAEMRMDNVAFLIERFARGLESGKTPETVLEEMSLLAEMVPTKMDRDADQKVKLMTMHAAKGLEFDHVYIIGMDNEALGVKDEDDKEELEEARRLTYVGVTRAKKMLAMSYSRERYEHGMIQSVTASPFLMEIAKGANVPRKKYSPQQGSQGPGR